MSEQRLIDANALPVYQRTIRYNTDEYVQEYVLAYDVRTAPTVDAVEVVHGRWEINEKFADYECSVCKQGDIIAPYFKRLKMNYCPNCGAKMDGGAEG